MPSFAFCQINESQSNKSSTQMLLMFGVYARSKAKYMSLWMISCKVKYMNNEQSVTQISAYRMDGVCDHKLRTLGSNGLFQWEAQIREINKKGSFFRHPRNLKRVKFCMYIFLFVSSACFKCFAYMYLIFNHKLEVTKNTAYIENLLSLIQLFSLHKKEYFIL